MNKKFLREVRCKLQAELSALQTSLTENSDASAPVELDQTRQGRLSRMDAMQQQAMAQATASSARARLAALGAALRRIDEGSYGECAGCGEMISAARLEARPEARLCISCESAAEAG